MDRRDFVTLLGGAVATWPLAALAQKTRSSGHVIGFLGTASREAYAERIDAISLGLRDTGFVEGSNLEIEYRWGEGRLDLLPTLVNDLVERKVHLIIATGGSPAALAAKAATSTVPIVFSTDGDPVKEGLVASLNRPESNATGISILTSALGSKRLEVFRAALAEEGVIAVLVNRSIPTGVDQALDAEQAAGSLGQRIVLVDVARQSEIETKLAELAKTAPSGLLITASPLFMGERWRLIELANRYRIATLGPRRDFAAAGALMSYGPDLIEPYRQLGQYAGRILKGEKPSNLPVQQPTKFDLVINLKTARILGLTVPPSLLARADEVIE
jgi:putative ABC transport system substrate-binding protein